MTTDVLVCKNHPERETGLRCKNCNEPICATCAKRTPTGYICPQCQRDQGRKFDTAKMQDYVVGFLIAAVLSWIGGFVISLIGFFIWFMFILSPLAGIIIAEAVRRAVGRRRSRLLFRLVTAGVVVGALPHVAQPLAFLLLGQFSALFSLLWPSIYIVLAASSAYVRLSGIQLTR
jgi:hypothetical protein